ncbi:asparaginase domain-containing protein [Defluviimonas sp. WL0050]|uniref:Asparaginase domain-containing protein n=1 Tax=Albidovulum litorale TaxID=2984134 RepID=A0ABT2ZIY7_9RHOB|nr:asparaginase domain-containing protein [Defluviimonas sp. WL0050]MCV2871095.1 asparaginase domain-containing protein [Defluviimonas sp. WL0050]
MTRILVLHTGGTIGMAHGPNGLAPQPGLVEEALIRLAPPKLDLTIHSFDPLIDSAEMGPAVWNRLIDRIAEWSGDGIIFTHGTDTMAFTGAALSAALPGLPIPVVLTGSMKPLGVPGDAESNLILALDAVSGAAPGVWLAFSGRILTGASVVKHHSSAPDSFRETQAAISMRGPFAPRHFPDRKLAILTLAPGFGAAVDAFGAALEHLDGAILRVFGAGTMMQDPKLLSVLSAATGRGCRIVAVSQCERGGLTPGAYAAGEALWASGVENGGTKTAERALADLWLDL